MDRDELLVLMDIIMGSEADEFTEEQVDRALFAFCAGCPDPVKAMWLVVECLDPMTDEELVDRALSAPLRRVADIPVSELPANHPIRMMAK